jgi:hypothetical protein
MSGVQRSDFLLHERSGRSIVSTFCQCPTFFR